MKKVKDCSVQMTGSAKRKRFTLTAAHNMLIDMKRRFVSLSKNFSDTF